MASQPGTNVPPSPTQFVGRAAELAALETLLATRARPITIVGPPGTGKTRLAIEYAARHAAEYEGGAWFCDLTETSDAHELCAALGRALDVPVTSGGTEADAVAQLGNAIAARGEMLLVLDNFEQLVVHAGATVRTWLDSAPRAQLLVTSRERLGLEGEQLYELSPLSLPREGQSPVEAEAVQLFVVRVRQVRHGYALTDREAPIVSQLVVELDGLPLAIELAASRMRLFSPSQILERMRNRFALLNRTAKRRRTLREAIDASWDLLADWEKATLMQCAVFRGGFTVDAAEVVVDLSDWAESPTTMDVLHALRDKSLLVATNDEAGELRLSMLLSIRDYAWDELVEVGAAEKTIDRHAEHFLRAAATWSQRAEGPADVEARRYLAREQENLLAVHRRALEAATPERALAAIVALEPVLSVAGPFGMYLSLVEAALATDPIALELRASALRTYARTLWSVGKVPQSEPVLEEALAIARERGDARLEGRVLFDLGTQWLLRTETAHAESFFTSALTILRAAGDRLTEGLTLVWLGRVRIMQGRLAEAQAHLEQGLERLREVGGRRRQADAIGGLADIALKQGRSEEASNHYARAIGLFREVGDRHNQAWALTNLAIVEQDRGELERARGTYEEARRIARDIGYRRLEANNLLYWATCLQEQGLDGEARQSLEQAQTMLHQTDDKWGEAIALSCLAALDASAENIDTARAKFDQADDLLRSSSVSPLLSALRLHRGHLDVALAKRAARAGQAEEAIQHLHDALQRASEATTDTEALHSDEARFALRMLRRSLDAYEKSHVPSASNEPADALVVAADARWFRPPHGVRIDLSRRGSMPRILDALAHHRFHTPGVSLSAAELTERGWPGVRILPQAAAKRFYMAIFTLRQLGLRDVLLSRDNGYLLDPDVPLVRVD